MWPVRPAAISVGAPAPADTERRHSDRAWTIACLRHTCTRHRIYSRSACMVMQAGHVPHIFRVSPSLPTGTGCTVQCIVGGRHTHTLIMVMYIQCNTDDSALYRESCGSFSGVDRWMHQQFSIQHSAAGTWWTKLARLQGTNNATLGLGGGRWMWAAPEGASRQVFLLASGPS